VLDSWQHWIDNSIAAAKAVCVKTAVRTSLDAALQCLMMGAESGCPIKSDRLENS